MSSPVLIELNDSGLIVARDGQPTVCEPGYALLDGRTLVIGDRAAAQARIAPQLVSHRFWDTLDQDTLPSEGAWRRTPAEVAYEQLQSLWQRAGEGVSGAILLVPATYTRAQLGLILGMCRKADIEVVSLVDSGLAALSSVPQTRQIVLVDLTLHRVCASHFTVGERIRRRATAEIDQFGLMDFHRRFAATMSDICVRSTRYDPMHSAVSEQALYDALGDTLSALRDQPTVNWTVQAPAELMNVKVTRSELAQSVAGLIGQIDTLIQGLVDPALGAPLIYVTQRLDFGPDVVGTLATAHGGVHVLAQYAAIHGVQSELTLFEQRAQAIGLITERPNHGTAQAPVATAAPSVRHVPASHILVDHQIHRIAGQPFVIGTATAHESWGYRVTGNVKGVSRKHCEILRDNARVVLRDLSTFGTFVNGRRVEGEVALGGGDIVRLGNPGIELRIVQEAATDGET